MINKLKQPMHNIFKIPNKLLWLVGLVIVAGFSCNRGAIEPIDPPVEWEIGNNIVGVWYIKKSVINGIISYDREEWAFNENRTLYITNDQNNAKSWSIDKHVIITTLNNGKNISYNIKKLNKKKLVIEEINSESNKQYFFRKKTGWGF